MRARGSHRFVLWLGTFLILLLLISVTHTWWLAALGRQLVYADTPAKADLAVVLAGDTRGNRILKAGELVRQGYVPAVLVSGPSGLYGHYECDLAIPYAVNKGDPAAWFIRFPNDTLSTREEARAVLGELRRRNVRAFLLVTSSYHTARAARIYHALERAEGGGPSFRTIPAADPYFEPGAWWHSREGLKIVFIELSKTIATAVGV